MQTAFWILKTPEWYFTVTISKLIWPRDISLNKKKMQL